MSVEPEIPPLAPGRKVLKRKNGRKDVYWVAAESAVKAGYRPKTVRLFDDPGDPVAPLATVLKCQVFQAEMLEWVAGMATSRNMAPAGTISWLIDLYLTDEDSPYRSIRQSSQPSYLRSLAIIKETVGDRRIDRVTGKDVRHWFKRWGRANDKGKLKHHYRAYSCIQLLRIIVYFGKETRDRATIELAQTIRGMRFNQPKGRSQKITKMQVISLIAGAHEMQMPSMALAISLQYGCSLRQKDVIGEWINEGGKQHWSSGLIWGQHIKKDWTLNKPTSKSNFEEIAEFDLNLIPLVMAELVRIPLEKRIGPVIRNETTGLPYRQNEFSRRFRRIAREVKIPDNIWNMDIRAGAITDALNKGAQPADVMKAATHKTLNMNLHYDRERLDKTDRVSKARFGRSNEENDENDENDY